MIAPAQILLAVVALIALWPTWVTLQRLLYSPRNWLWVPLMVVVACTMAAVATGVSMAFIDGNAQHSIEPNDASWLKSALKIGSDQVIDFTLFGMMPIMVIALAGYVIDHIADRVSAGVVATAACLATAIMPICFIIVNPIGTTAPTEPPANVGTTSDLPADTNSSSPS